MRSSGSWENLTKVIDFFRYFLKNKTWNAAFKISTHEISVQTEETNKISLMKAQKTHECGLVRSCAKYKFFCSIKLNSLY